MARGHGRRAVSQASTPLTTSHMARRLPLISLQHSSTSARYLPVIRYMADGGLAMTAVPPDLTDASGTPAAFGFLKTIMPDVPPELQPLLVLGYDVDAFEKDIARFATQLGIPVEELLEVAAEARTGSDPSSDKRPRQHVVSRSVLAAWSTGTSRNAGDQEIWPYSIETGPEAPIDPTCVGIVPDFVKVDSKKTEQKWEEVENTLRQVVAQLDASPNISDRLLIEKVKKIVALHWARSIETLEAVESLCTVGVANVKTSLLQNPDLVDARYRQASGDPSAILSESARKEFVQLLTNRAEWIFMSGTWFRFDVIYMFRRSLQLMDRLKLQVFRAPNGSEFLIGDSPVVKLDDHGVRRGSANPIPIGNAISVLMPLSPRFMVVLDNLGGDVTIPETEVQKYNLWQLEAAHERVFMHPRANSLMAWVEKTRAPTAP